MPTIRIHSLQFTLSSRYVAGHCLSETEAQALDSLRAENIRNLLLPQVNKAIVEAGAEPLTEATVAGLADRCAQYDLEYQFRPRRQYTRLSPVDQEAQAIARLRALIEADGAIAEEELVERTLALAGLPDVQAEAQRRVAERQAIAAALLDELT